MDIPALVKITSRAWCLDILALMHSGTPGRQAPLLAASGAGRTAFGQSLSHLLEAQLLERNPGHGHPLRPEYRLTPKGVDAARIAYRIRRVVSDPTDCHMLRRVWTVPVLVVSQQPRHFTEIKTALEPITDRALSQSLKQLRTQRWLERTVDTERLPPRSLYRASGVGAQIGAAVNPVSI